jgi:hypothetical protein
MMKNKLTLLESVLLAGGACFGLLMVTGMVVVLRCVFQKGPVSSSRLFVGLCFAALGVVGAVGGSIELKFPLLAAGFTTPSSYQQLLAFVQDSRKGTDTVSLIAKYPIGTGLSLQLVEFRIQIRSSLREVCIRHELISDDKQDHALKSLLQMTRDRDLIDDQHYSTIFGIASDTHFIEWSNADAPGEDRLRQILKQAPEELKYLASVQ